MRPECIQRLAKAAGRALTESELRTIEEGIGYHYEQITDTTIPKAERYRLASQKASEDMFKEASYKVHARIDEAIKHHKIEKDIEQYEAGLYGRSQALFQKLFYRAGDNAVSLEKKIQARQHDMLAPFSEFSKLGTKNWGFAHDKDFSLSVAKALKGEKIHDPTIKKLASTYENTMKQLHEMAEDAGIRFNFLKNRIPQPTDSYKLQMAGINQYVDDVLQLIDRSKYKEINGAPWTEEKLKKFVKEVYAERVGESGGKTGHSFSGRVGARREHERQIHFKDADSHMSYMENYGTSSNINQILTADIQTLIKDVTIAEEFGSHADAFVRKLIAKYHAEDVLKTDLSVEGAKSRVTGTPVLDSLKKSMVKMWEVQHNGENVHNTVWANYMSGVRSLLSSSLLGMHPIQALIEDSLLATSFMSRIGISKADIKKAKQTVGWSNPAHVLKDLRVITESVIAGGRHISEGENYIGVTHKLNDMVHTASQAKRIDDRTRSTVSLLLSNQIGRFTTEFKTLADLKANAPERVKRFFSAFNETDFAILRKAEKDGGADGYYSLVSSKAVKEINDADIKDVVEKSLAEKSPVYEKAKEALRDRRDKRIERELSKVDKKFEQSIQNAERDKKLAEDALPNMDKQIQAEREVAEKNLVETEEKRSQIVNNRYKATQHKLNDLRKKAKSVEKELKDLPGAEHKEKARLSKIIEDLKESLEKESKAYAGKVKDYGRKSPYRVRQIDLDKFVASTNKNPGKINELRLEQFKEKAKQIHADIDKATAEQKNYRKSIASKYLNLVKESEALADRIKKIEIYRDTPPKNININLADLHHRHYVLGTDWYRNKTKHKLTDTVKEKTSILQNIHKAYKAERAAKEQAIRQLTSPEEKAFIQRMERMRSKEASRLKEKVSNKLNAKILTELQTGATGAMSRTLLDKNRLGLLDLPKGSVLGEVLRCILQFKSTPMAMFMTHMQDLPNAHKMPNGGTVTKEYFRTKFAAQSILAGVVATQIKLLLDGRDPTDFSKPRDFVNAVMETGAMHPLLGLVTPSDRNPTASQLALNAVGPALSIGFRSLDALHDVYNGKNPTPKVLGVSRSIIPLMRIWYTNQAYNAMVNYHLHEMFSPGFMQRKQRIMEKHGESFFRNTNELLPHRAPNLGKMIGQ